MPEASLRSLVLGAIKDRPLLCNIKGLTTQEKKVAVLTMCGWSASEIAKDFGRTPGAIRKHKRVKVRKGKEQ